MNNISVVILTFNSSASIQVTLDAIKQVTDDINVIDSHSSDNTVDILEQNDCKVISRAFKNYSDQRNWAIENLSLKYEWQLHVDADEVLEESLIDQINSLNLSKSAFDGYIIGRKIVFMNKVLRFGGIAKTWHYRLFKNGYGKCEDRNYDQHFVSSGSVGKLNAFMLDYQNDTLSEWTARHNRWSDMESKEILQSSNQNVDQIKPDMSGNAIERKRAQKALYYKLPLFLRAFSYFFVRYFFQLGILDGRAGFIYHILQGFWFRFLVDAKIYEAKQQIKKGN